MSSASNSQTPPPQPTKTVTPVPEFTIMDFVNLIILVLLVIAGAYFGWKFGSEWSYGYWTKIQEWGVWFGIGISALFQSAKTKAAEYRAQR
jgi:hypothetical protein